MVSSRWFSPRAIGQGSRVRLRAAQATSPSSRRTVRGYESFETSSRVHLQRPAPHRRPDAAGSNRRAGAHEHQAEFRPGGRFQRSTAALSLPQRGPAPSRPPGDGSGREALHALCACPLETTPELVKSAAARQARAGTTARFRLYQGSGRGEASRCRPPWPARGPLLLRVALGLQAMDAAAALPDRLLACPLEALRSP